MQYHLDGYRPGDPAMSPPTDAATDPATRPGALPDEVDVLVVGCGPAGLTLAAQLAQFPDISTAIVELKPSRLTRGQADGIAVRTMEMFHAFGFSERVLKEAYWVNETTFWRPDVDHPERIVRDRQIRDVEEGLSEFPHVILNQARVHDFYLDVMRNGANRLEPTYSHRVVDLAVDPVADHPVTVTLEHVDHDADSPAGPADTTTVRARYVVGCDGGRSTVRRLVNRPLLGDSANQSWGVMDVLAVTDFPDIRLKSTILSAEEGNLLIIPREGGYLVRLYVELDELADGERVAGRNVTADHVVAAAKRILHPYTLDVHEIAWWSVYEIGQRLCDRFDDLADDEVGRRGPRVFIAGDAGHTHSPKAGQGMNVSMRDSFNLGWKLAAVLRGQAVPALLDTYSAERHAVARELIDFDREFARMFSARPSPGDDGDDGDGIDPAEFQRYFVQKARFTHGTETCYAPSLITGDDAFQELATGFPIGMRFHSAPVVRLADARPMHLGHVIEADGRWRLFAFAPQPGSPSTPESAGADDVTGLVDLCRFLEHDEHSPVRRHTPACADPDAVLDVRAVLRRGHRDVPLEALPPFLLPRKGRHGLIDYQKVFCPDPGADVFDLRGIAPEGCLVVVRPDQHVATILPLHGHDLLAEFFARILIAR